MNSYIRIFIEVLLLPILKRALTKRKKRLMASFNFRRIAVMKFASLGDYVLLSHAIKALKLKFPDSKITFICNNKKYAEIFEGSPYVDNFEYFGIFDRNEQFNHPLSAKFLKELIVFYFRNLFRGFDLLINFNRVENTFTLIMNLIVVSAANARKKMGLDTGGRGFFYYASIPDSYYQTRLDSYTYLELVSLLGAKDDRNFESLVIPAEAEGRIEELLKAAAVKGSLVCFHPGGFGKNRRWPAESFACLGNNLIRKFDVDIILVGGKGETKIGEKIASVLVKKPINLIGMTTSLGLTALIKRCQLFIGNQSGPMHIAVACGIPTIGIVGPGLARYYSYQEPYFRYVKSKSDCPFVRNLTECLDPNCSTAECMDEISVKDVEVVVDQMQKGGLINLNRHEDMLRLPDIAVG